MSTDVFAPLAVAAASAVTFAVGDLPVGAAPVGAVRASGFAPLVFPVLRDTVPGEAAERALVQGHAAGYAAGRREAAVLLAEERAALAAERDRTLAEARTAVSNALGALDSATRRVEERAAAALGATDAVLLAAAVELAAVIVGRELADGPASAVAAVRRALAGAGAGVVQAVRLHPHDLALIDPADAPVPLLADPALTPGDAVAVLADGLVDGRIGTALERLRAAAAEDVA